VNRSGFITAEDQEAQECRPNVPRPIVRPWLLPLADRKACVSFGAGFEQLFLSGEQTAFCILIKEITKPAAGRPVEWAIVSRSRGL
jgi:hypothetical protein